MKIPSFPHASIWTPVACACIAGVVLFGLFGIGSRRIRAQLLGEKLLFDPIDQIEVSENQIKLKDVTVLSLATTQVDIVGARTPCTCISVERIPVTIKQGEKRQITLRIDGNLIKKGEHAIKIPLYLSVESAPVNLEFKLVVN